MRHSLLSILVAMSLTAVLTADEQPATVPTSSDSGSDKAAPAADSGYRVLRTVPFLPPDFDQETLDDLWKRWPANEREAVENLPLEERRKAIRERYGLMPASDEHGPLLGYVKTQQGFVMNCLACHGGQVNGTVMPGLANSNYSLQTLTEDVRNTKLTLRKRFTHLDGSVMTTPLSGTEGTTNAVMFGVILSSLRDPDMTVNVTRVVPPLLHHDVDPPPLWNTSRKKQLYIDGFTPKNHRAIMQFMLLPTNGREKVYGWEKDFRSILEWIESLEPPPYPFEIDQDLAGRGEAVFNQNCSSCHGTYGKDGRYPEKMVPIDDVQTDSVRLRAIGKPHREWVKSSWMSYYGKQHVDTEPAGYVAPPLNGIWASAPYFHNGSVPTLWHVLHPGERPVVWKRSFDGYDQKRVGVEVEEFPSLPETANTPREQRRFYQTSKKGKSAGGHLYPESLTAEEKRALLEYLKTL